MKEVKYKIWDTFQKKMYDWQTILDSNCSLKDFLAKVYIKLEYTGLTDKNGKEIYQGDIVQYNTKTHAIILWNNQEACFEGLVIESHARFFIHKEPVIIIGDIYRNPELINNWSNVDV